MAQRRDAKGTWRAGVMLGAAGSRARATGELVWVAASLEGYLGVMG